MLRVLAGLSAFLATSVSPLAAEPEWGRVIVMVNDATGSVVRRVNLPRARMDAWAEEQQKNGYRILMTSTATGFGATFCVSKDRQVQFFYSHPHESVRDAIDAARDRARPAAARLDEVTFICGRPWEVLERVPADRLQVPGAPRQ